MPSNPKQVLKDYLRGARDTLIWKLSMASPSATSGYRVRRLG